MRLALLSDTHSRHGRLSIPEADLVLHAGDFTRRGRLAEAVSFLDWLATWPCPRVLIAGNHDYIAEEEPEKIAALCREREIHYLCDSSVRLSGLTIWGSPWSPRFGDMAFNLERGPDIASKWSAIPENLDVLLTHTPPARILDRIYSGRHVGCADLAATIAQRPPRLHAFGHIHESAGETTIEDIRYINAANCRLIAGIRPPLVVELSPRR